MSESGHSDVYGAGNANDGNKGSYWESVNNAWPQHLTVDLAAAAVGDHRRKAAHLVAAGKLHVLVGIDIGQHEGAAVLPGEPFQQRRQHAAGPAPAGADIHQHRHLMRACHHALIEIRFTDVAEKIHA